MKRASLIKLIASAPIVGAALTRLTPAVQTVTPISTGIGTISEKPMINIFLTGVTEEGEPIQQWVGSVEESALDIHVPADELASAARALPSVQRFLTTANSAYDRIHLIVSKPNVAVLTEFHTALRVGQLPASWAVDKTGWFTPFWVSCAPDYFDTAAVKTLVMP